MNIASKNNSTTSIRKRLMGAALSGLAVLTLAVTPISMAHADSTYSPLNDSGTIGARQIYVYHMDFNAHEEAQVAAVGNGDLDIKIYDENGNLITKDTSPDGVPVVTWRPEWMGRFTIKIINNEYHGVHFAMRTN